MGNDTSAESPQNVFVDYKIGLDDSDLTESLRGYFKPCKFLGVNLLGPDGDGEFENKEFVKSECLIGTVECAKEDIRIKTGPIPWYQQIEQSRWYRFDMNDAVLQRKMVQFAKLVINRPENLRLLERVRMPVRDILSIRLPSIPTNVKYALSFVEIHSSIFTPAFFRALGTLLLEKFVLTGVTAGKCEMLLNSRTQAFSLGLLGQASLELDFTNACKKMTNVEFGGNIGVVNRGEKDANAEPTVVPIECQYVVKNAEKIDVEVLRFMIDRDDMSCKETRANGTRRENWIIQTIKAFEKVGKLVLGNKDCGHECPLKPMTVAVTDDFRLDSLVPPHRDFYADEFRAKIVECRIRQLALDYSVSSWMYACKSYILTTKPVYDVLEIQHGPKDKKDEDHFVGLFTDENGDITGIYQWNVYVLNCSLQYIVKRSNQPITNNISINPNLIFLGNSYVVVSMEGSCFQIPHNAKVISYAENLQHTEVHAESKSLLSSVLGIFSRKTEKPEEK